MSTLDVVKGTIHTNNHVLSYVDILSKYPAPVSLCDTHGRGVPGTAAAVLRLLLDGYTGNAQLLTETRQSGFLRRSVFTVLCKYNSERPVHGGSTKAFIDSNML